MLTSYGKALAFAAIKHRGTKRKNGDNYIIHPIRVSQEVKTERQKIIALIHDTVEDTETTLKEIETKFGFEVAWAVDCLTHRAGEVYRDYIERVKQDPDAVAVKIADICDNLSDSPSEGSIHKAAYGITELLATVSAV